jgi:hypothetical protein
VPVGVDDCVVVVDVVEPVAAFPVPELSTKPPSAPPSIEPAATIVTIHLFPIFTCHLLSFGCLETRYGPSEARESAV